MFFLFFSLTFALKFAVRSCCSEAMSEASICPAKPVLSTWPLPADELYIAWVKLLSNLMFWRVFGVGAAELLWVPFGVKLNTVTESLLIDYCLRLVTEWFEIVNPMSPESSSITLSSYIISWSIKIWCGYSISPWLGVSGKTSTITSWEFSSRMTLGRFGN